MAAKKRRKSTATRRRVSGTAVGSTAVGKTVGSTAVGATRRRRSRRVSGVGAPRRKRRRSGGGGGFLGATNLGNFGAIAKMAAGVAVGALGTHIILRPLERRLVQQAPWAAKFMAAGEIIIGGMIAIKSKSNTMKAVGVGILANGVNGVMNQFPMGMPSPGERSKVVGDYTEVVVPINGTYSDMMSGLIDGDNGAVNTPTVGGFIGSILDNYGGPVNTPMVGGLPMGITEEETDAILYPRGYMREQ